jgi:hypothetical protein
MGMVVVIAVPKIIRSIDNQSISQKIPLVIAWGVMVIVVIAVPKIIQPIDNQSTHKKIPFLSKAFFLNPRIKKRE